MARIGGMELLVVLIVALFAIGPERLPKVARSLGRSLGEFKRSMNSAMKDLTDSADEFKAVGEALNDAQREMRGALRETDEEIRKTGREVDETMSGKSEKKKKKKPAEQDGEAASEAPEKRESDGEDESQSA